MPSKQAKRRDNAKQAQSRDALHLRPFSVRASTVNEGQRSVETVIATENPVLMYDWDRYERVPEILRADGAVLPSQVPLLDNHARWSSEDQIGSTRAIERQGDQIVGRIFFATAADRQWELVRDGHLTDVSAGYQVLEKTFVPKNTRTTIGGRQYEGPLNVVTKWKLREVSLTPIGADEQAKLRGLELSESPEEKGFAMNEQLRALLESRGMPQGLSDDEAQRWAVEHSFGERKEPEKKPPGEDAKEREAKERDAKLSAMITRSVEEATRKALEDADKQRIALRSKVDTLCKIAGITPTVEQRTKLDACRSHEEIEKTILDIQAERSKGDLPLNPVFPGPAAVDKFTDGMRTALILRAIDHVDPDSDEAGVGDGASRRERAIAKVFPVAERSKDGAAFKNASLFDLARQYVESVYGVRTIDLTREHTAIVAMFGPQRASEILGLELRDAGAYHTTGSFAEITRDAVNKSMMLGYTEARSTWEMVMRRGASVPDFKQINRLVLGAVPNLPVWPDNEDPHKASFQDAREYYVVECRSLEVDFSYRLLINDDMDAISRTPGMLGNAARRTVNKVAWTPITANPLLRDGVALFSAASGARKRNNLETGTVTDYTAAINLLTANMMVMRGENTPEGNESDDVLGLMPRYIAFPAAIRGTLLQLVRSQSDPQADHAGVTNINNTLIPVVEPLLDANSATAFYLFADKAEIDTVEVTFLQGQETPQVRQYLDPKKLSQSWTVLQTFGAKALNHRGIQKHAGA